jgi:hypothetical protein
VKLQDDHQLPSLSFSFKQPDVLHSLVPSFTVDVPVINVTSPNAEIHSPPDKLFEDIYLINCVFRV